MHENLVPGPFLVLANSLKQAVHARNSFESKIRYFEKGLSKDFILFTNKIMKNKRGLELVTSLSWVVKYVNKNCF